MRKWRSPVTPTRHQAASPPPARRSQRGTDRAALRRVTQQLRHVGQHGDGRDTARRARARIARARGEERSEDGAGLAGERRGDAPGRRARVEVARRTRRIQVDQPRRRLPGEHRHRGVLTPAPPSSRRLLPRMRTAPSMMRCTSSPAAAVIGGRRPAGHPAQEVGVLEGVRLAVQAEARRLRQLRLRDRRHPGAQAAAGLAQVEHEAVVVDPQRAVRALDRHAGARHGMAGHAPRRLELDRRAAGRLERGAQLVLDRAVHVPPGRTHARRHPEARAQHEEEVRGQVRDHPAAGSARARTSSRAAAGRPGTGTSRRSRASADRARRLRAGRRAATKLGQKASV